MELFDHETFLSEEELNAVSGGRVSANDYAALRENLKDAMQDFAQGNLLGGLQALSQCTPPPPPNGWL